MFPLAIDPDSIVMATRLSPARRPEVLMGRPGRRPGATSRAEGARNGRGAEIPPRNAGGTGAGLDRRGDQGGGAAGAFLDDLHPRSRQPVPPWPLLCPAEEPELRAAGGAAGN